LGKDIAIIGVGRFGTKLLERFNLFGNVTFLCGRRLAPELMVLGQKYGIQISTNYQEILDQIDLAVIATPANTHYSIVKDCLLNNKHIFVEKPLYTNLAEAKECLDLAKKKNLTLYVDDVFLYRNEYQELKARLSGEIDTIRFIWRKYGSFKESILNNLLYHDLYLLTDLLGKNKIHDFEVINCSSPLEEERIDILEFKFRYGKTAVKCEYNRAYSGESEKEIKLILDSRETITWNNNDIFVGDTKIDLEVSDALDTMLSRFLNDEVNYARNHLLALNSIALLEDISIKIGSKRI